MFIFPRHLFVPMQGKRPDPQWKEGSSSALLTGIPPGKPHWLPSPRRDWDSGCRGAVACSSTWGPQMCAGPSTQDWPFFLLSFPSFSPFLSLLSPLLPSAASALTGLRWRPEVSPSAAPLQMPVPWGVCAFQRWKGAECCPEWQQVTKNFQKKWAKPFPFLYWELLSLPRPRHTGPHSARSGWLSKSKWREAQLISVHSLKLQVKGGRGRNNEVFN